MLAAGLSAGNAAAAERLVFQSRTEKTSPWHLEFADPLGSATTNFATAPQGTTLIDPTWSHDRKTISFYEQFGRGTMLKPAAGGTEMPFLGADAIRPSWSPVASEIAYWALVQGKVTLKVATTDGLGTRTLAGPYDPGTDMPLVGPEQPAWSADGKTIAFARGRGIHRVPALGGAVTQLVAGGPPNSFLAHEPSYAPDGKRLAYMKLFDDQNGSFTSWQLVVRDLQNQQEQVIANGATSGSNVSSEFHGPQSWRPDSTAVAYVEDIFNGGPPSTHNATLWIARSDGSGSFSLVQPRWALGPPSWGGGGPNYYVKYIEVAQAIAPDLAALPTVDPLSADPIGFDWPLPSVAGSSIPLVAGKETLLRVYVGDGALPQGETDEREVRWSVTGGTLPQPVERIDNVRVTAPDVAPLQGDAVAALNVWLPPSVGRSGGRTRLDVEVNTGQHEPECDGCHPEGNRAFLDGMLFEDGGQVILAPVPIYVVTPDLKFIPPTRDFSQSWPLMTPMLPLGDSGVRGAPEPATLSVGFNDMLAEGDDDELPEFWPCSVLLSRLEELRLLSTTSPVPAPGAFRWVGYTDHPLAKTSCGGQAYQPGRSILLTGLSRPTAVHELGHSLGLPHTLGYGKNVPGGAVALPYIGIGGVGYENFVGYLTTLDKLKNGDVMSYSPDRWTSPATWHRMFEAILAESGASGQAAAVDRPEAAARARVGARRSRRLVSGFMVGGRAALLRSLTADAAQPQNSGSVIGRIVARDRRGRKIATVKVRGSTAVPSDETQPFMVALPASKRITSLTLLGGTGRKPLDRLKASRHAPQARFVRVPKRASAKKKLTVRWRASDRDRDKLSVTLLAKRGNGSWDTIAMGPPRFRASVEPRTLGRGKRLRLRLVVTDGFNTTTTAPRSLRLKG